MWPFTRKKKKEEVKKNIAVCSTYPRNQGFVRNACDTSKSSLPGGYQTNDFIDNPIMYKPTTDTDNISFQPSIDTNFGGGDFGGGGASGSWGDSDSSSSSSYDSSSSSDSSSYDSGSSSDSSSSSSDF